MSQDLDATRRYLKQHHGGDGDQAAERTISTHARNHDESFRSFWRRHLPSGTDLHIADLGCGPALFLKELAKEHPGFRLTGIEIAPYMLARIHDKPDNLEIRVADLNAPGNSLFSQAPLDACLANLLLHELHQPVMLLNALRHWLKPGGVLIITDIVRQPLASWLRHKFPNSDLGLDTLSAVVMHDAFRDYQEHNRYDTQDLVDLLELCGFEVLEIEPLRDGRAVRIAARNPATL